MRRLAHVESWQHMHAADAANSAARLSTQKVHLILVMASIMP